MRWREVEATSQSSQFGKGRFLNLTEISLKARIKKKISLKTHKPLGLSFKGKLGCQTSWESLAESEGDRICFCSALTIQVLADASGCPMGMLGSSSCWVTPRAEFQEPSGGARGT